MAPLAKNKFDTFLLVRVLWIPPLPPDTRLDPPLTLIHTWNTSRLGLWGVLAPGRRLWWKWVGFVTVRDCQKNLRIADTGPFQNNRTAARSLNRLNIQIFWHPPNGSGVFIDDHNFFVFQCQMIGDVKPDLTCTDNNDFQWFSSLLSLGARARLFVRYFKVVLKDKRRTSNFQHWTSNNDVAPLRNLISFISKLLYNLLIVI